MGISCATGGSEDHVTRSGRQPDTQQPRLWTRAWWRPTNALRPVRRHSQQPYTGSSPATVEYINKLWHGQTLDCCTATAINAVQLNATQWVSLTNSTSTPRHGAQRSRHRALLKQPWKRRGQGLAQRESWGLGPVHQAPMTRANKSAGMQLSTQG